MRSKNLYCRSIAKLWSEIFRFLSNLTSQSWISYFILSFTISLAYLELICNISFLFSKTLHFLCFCVHEKFQKYLFSYTMNPKQQLGNEVSTKRQTTFDGKRIFLLSLKCSWMHNFFDISTACIFTFSNEKYLLLYHILA